MKKAFNRCLGVCVFFVMFLPLTGCVRNITGSIIKTLDQDKLYKSYNIHPTDLFLRSKCKAPPSVKIVNIESRTEDYEIFQNSTNTWFITPKEMVDSFCLYLKNGFEKSHIPVDVYSTKVLQIRMIDLQVDVGFGYVNGGYCKMELIIPETKFSKFYEARDNASQPGMAPAYAIHGVTRQIIDDPVIQDYLLCNTMATKKESPTGETALDILKKRYVRGEITKDQFERMKQDIQ
ncbi:MAG: SHOCT domain-containing protein [Deltaproteobacteria bacterium]